MLVVETIGRIRREHFVQGKSIKEIARDLRLSRNTVRKVLRSEETSFSYERQVQPRPKLGRWKEELDRLLATNAEASARERLTLIRLFEELRALGYEGGCPPLRARPGEDESEHDHRPWHRRAEGPLPRPDAPRRRGLVPAVLRAGRRL